MRTARDRYAEAAAGRSEVARLVGAAGESGDAAPLERAGGLLGELARIEREAMGELARLPAGSDGPVMGGRPRR